MSLILHKNRCAEDGLFSPYKGLGELDYAALKSSCESFLIELDGWNAEIRKRVQNVLDGYDIRKQKYGAPLPEETKMKNSAKGVLSAMEKILRVAKATLN